MPSFNDMWGNLDDGYPNDWIPADPGIDDWVRPGEWYTQPPPAVPSSPQQAFGAQPDLSAPQAGTVPNSGPWNDPAPGSTSARGTAGSGLSAPPTAGPGANIAPPSGGPRPAAATSPPTGYAGNPAAMETAAPGTPTAALSGQKPLLEWQQFERDKGSQQTTRQTTYQGEDRTVRLDFPPDENGIADLKMYNWGKPGYQRPFLRELCT